MDSAFFNQDILSLLSGNQIKFTASVAFERFAQLKQLVEKRKRWRKIDSQWSYFEAGWKPKSWNESFRVIFTRKKNKKHRKGPCNSNCLNQLITIMTIRSSSRTKVNQRKALFCSTMDMDLKKPFLVTQKTIPALI